MNDILFVFLNQSLARESVQALLILLGAMTWVVYIKSRGAAAVRATRLPQKASPPRPVDLAFPGSNLEFLQEGARRLKALGFRHLLDYELPHLQLPKQRLVSSSYVEEEGRVFASLSQRFSPSFAHDMYSFVTWFRSGKRLVSTSSLYAGGGLNPQIHHLLSPLSRDPEKMARRHRQVLERWIRRGEEPILVRTPEELARVVVDSWDEEIESLARAGYHRRDPDGQVGPAEKFIRAIFWQGLSPVRRGFSLPYHLIGIGGPAIGLAAALLALPGPMLAMLWPLYGLAGFLLGWMYGYFFQQHGAFWCLILPALFFRTHPPSAPCRHSIFFLIASTTAFALIGLQLGFFRNATRARARGQRALAAAGPPAGKPPA